MQDAQAQGEEYRGDSFEGRVVADSPLHRWLLSGHEPRDLFLSASNVIKSRGHFRTGIVRIEGQSDHDETTEIFVKEYGLSR